MDTLVSFLFAVLLTFFFVRRYLKRLAPGAKPLQTPAARTAEAAITCPRCSGSLPADASFCSYCGAALAMWRVHRAETREASAAVSANQLRPLINTSVCIGCGNCAKACDIEGTLQVVNGKSILAHPERCQGHALCADACPTGALRLASGEALQTVRVPSLGANFETNVPGLYIAGELGGAGLIRTAINEGKLAVDDIVRRLNGNRSDGGDVLDLLIVGSGPAGLSASLAAHQRQVRYVTLEQGEIASTIRHFPRHKLVMAEPVDIPLYGSLYVGDGSKEALLAIWETIIKSTDLHVQTHERVESVQKQEDDHFLVQSSRQQYRSRTVLLAMGKQGLPRRLGVPGEESAKVLYRLIEAEGYSDNDILVVGGGDSAIEAAVALGRINDNRVTLSYRGDSFKRARDRNREKLEAHQADGKVKVILESEVASIAPEAVRLRRSGEELELANQFVFAMVGGESPEAFLRRSGVEIVEKVLGG